MSCSDILTNDSLYPVMCFDAPLPTSQSLLPCEIVPVSAEISTYYSFESSFSHLDLLFVGVHHLQQYEHGASFSWWENLLQSVHFRHKYSIEHLKYLSWYSFATCLASSFAHSSQSLLKEINFLLAQIPWMNESHDLGRPFKIVIAISPLKLSLTASSCYLIWSTLVK